MKVSAKLAIFAIFAFLTLNPTAQASLLLEPYVGYVSGSSKTTSSSNFTGTEYGARVGYSVLGFAIGAEYDATSFTDDLTPKDNLSSGDLGAFVAYKFPILLRVYGTYFPASEIKAESNGTTSTYKSGNLTKLGVGFTGLPFININVEYILGSYSKVVSAGTEVSLDPKLTSSAFALSISAPFNLF